MKLFKLVLIWSILCVGCTSVKKSTVSMRSVQNHEEFDQINSEDILQLFKQHIKSESLQIIRDSLDKLDKLEGVYFSDSQFKTDQLSQLLLEVSQKYFLIEVKIFKLKAGRNNWPLFHHSKSVFDAWVQTIVGNCEGAISEECHQNIQNGLSHLGVKLPNDVSEIPNWYEKTLSLLEGVKMGVLVSMPEVNILEIEPKSSGDIGGLSELGVRLDSKIKQVRSRLNQFQSDILDDNFPIQELGFLIGKYLDNLQSPYAQHIVSSWVSEEMAKEKRIQNFTTVIAITTIAAGFLLGPIAPLWVTLSIYGVGVAASGIGSIYEFIYSGKLLNSSYASLMDIEGNHFKSNLEEAKRARVMAWLDLGLFAVESMLLAKDVRKVGRAFRAGNTLRAHKLKKIVFQGKNVHLVSKDNLIKYHSDGGYFLNGKAYGAIEKDFEGAYHFSDRATAGYGIYGGGLLEVALGYTRKDNAGLSLFKLKDNVNLRIIHSEDINQLFRINPNFFKQKIKDYFGDSIELGEHTVWKTLGRYFKIDIIIDRTGAVVFQNTASFINPKNWDEYTEWFLDFLYEFPYVNEKGAPLTSFVTNHYPKILKFTSNPSRFPSLEEVLANMAQKAISNFRYVNQEMKKRYFRFMTFYKRSTGHDLITQEMRDWRELQSNEFMNGRSYTW